MPFELLTWLPIGLLGLAVGSFLNVVIHRLPRMLQAQWAAEALAHESQPETEDQRPSYNLSWPGSHCPHCHTALRWSDNIPVLSYLWLRGHCRQCRGVISWRYPAIELLTCALFLWSVTTHGVGASALAWAGFASALVALAAIDADTHLLPDAITQPLVWAGLLAASGHLSGQTLSDALWGAVAGYLFLWTVYWLFKLLTGKEGMGQGDFKLLAALGAWLGWPALVSLVLIASLTGLAGGLVLRARHRLSEDGYIPFGPFLALAGLWVMAWGPLPGLHL
ncbi:prepilin peptidase [Limnohabitans sp. MMS-10A-160]|uniref:prepilin peptidase n=1 Tax=unclassified Limnohabitans TaxID=2626134 RepID=UPI000D36128A|nr:MULTISPECIES: A24 family peptidase [unclassified Limnohabitans]PUE19721.1 prepilin peptidase [Limnohabitans sp. MMS-10A-192]PUE27082.1 prepilin peptidase [Limnohabitans sp. MMS-10A-160]